jgi:hypothetical protein
MIMIIRLNYKVESERIYLAGVEGLPNFICKPNYELLRAYRARFYMA